MHLSTPGRRKGPEEGGEQGRGLSLMITSSAAPSSSSPEFSHFSKPPYEVDGTDLLILETGKQGLREVM